VIDRAAWTLAVEGAVERRVALGWDDLRAAESVTTAATLRCIGEPVDGSLMDTAVWTGVPLAGVLDRAAPTGDHAVVHAADGYYERLPLSVLRDALLVFGMNGERLPRAHGYPVRLVMPGTWGKINTKWIERIEIRGEPGEGYWSARGWEGTAPMRTVAKLWSLDWGTEATLGGHAYAGRRGVESVEVSLDDGATWRTAALSRPPDGPAVWRQWRYAFEPDREAYAVAVRARDGDGRLQAAAESEPFPDGATGYDRARITPETTLSK